MHKLIDEAKNAPVSFLGGVIAICGLAYSFYVLLLNGDLPTLPYGNNIFKLLVLILIEAPLAYFFVKVHVKMAEKGHGIPLFVNFFTIIASASVSYTHLTLPTIYSV